VSAVVKVLPLVLVALAISACGGARESESSPLSDREAAQAFLRAFGGPRASAERRHEALTILTTVQGTSG
jgi:hypothetical protein